MASLRIKKRALFLDGKEFRILSGAVHYFRCHPNYWEDVLVKIKACGLNTVEIYVPWNMHEEIKDVFNFNGFLDIRAFVLLAKKVGLYVLFRPGPYICAEWDFGGLPSWLLCDPDMKVRSSYKPYLDAVDRYFAKLMPQVSDLQFGNGGPIIAAQVENEYGSYGTDTKYMTFIQQTMEKYGINEMLFTSDNNYGTGNGALPGVWMTANHNKLEDAKVLYERIRKVDSDWPLMTMEYWSGWFDHWGETHHTISVDKYGELLRYILERGSVNVYMFFGGTNFGFMNGANAQPYTSTITSYDYDAPLTESGNPSPKYYKTKELLQEVVPSFVSVKLPALPVHRSSKAYGQVQMKEVLTFHELLASQVSMTSKDAISMEMLPINDGSGQGYGFISYRAVCSVSKSSHNDNTVSLTFQGHVRDRALVYVDGKQVAILDDKTSNQKINFLLDKEIPGAFGVLGSYVGTLDIMVENMGRINYVNAGSNELNEQRKGLSSPVFLNDTKIENWEIFPLEFKKNNLERATASNDWKAYTKQSQASLSRATLNISGDPEDTYINMAGWTKGVVFVNSFNLGRYWNIGPTKTMYVPGPLMRSGKNEFYVFELHGSGDDLQFVDSPNLG